MNNKTTKLETSADGIFMHSKNPSPVMQAAMDSIRAQMKAEAEYRDRVRAGLEPAPRTQNWGTWNISDRHEGGLFFCPAFPILGSTFTLAQGAHLIGTACATF